MDCEYSEYDRRGFTQSQTSATEFWDSEIQDEIERDNFIMNPVSIVEGIYQCRKCGSGNVLSFNKQIRSSDEGTTVFCTCVKCNTKWREE